MEPLHGTRALTPEILDVFRGQSRSWGHRKIRETVASCKQCQAADRRRTRLRHLHTAYRRRHH